MNIQFNLALHFISTETLVTMLNEVKSFGDEYVTTNEMRYLLECEIEERAQLLAATR